MDEDMWYDMYGDDVDFDFYEDVMEDVWEENIDVDSPSFLQTFHGCLLPTFGDVKWHIVRIILSCALLRVVNFIEFIPTGIRHFISICSGAWLAFQFFSRASLYLVIFTGIAFIILKCSYNSKKCSYCLALFSVIYSVFCELVVADEKRWHRVRGANMNIVMKVVSIAFDLDSVANPTMPSFLPFVDYCFTPATIVFGPWISYSDHIKMITQKNADNVSWIFKLIKCLVLSLVLLSVSTCWSQWLFGISGSTIYVSLATKWMLAYGGALSYRCSHYFVSYLSECSTTVSGIHHDVKVAQPYHVEFPRSLVEVVIHWNLPMHYWLKTYVFKVARRYSAFLAIFSTYAASALLHGLNFQLAAVLLSLGFHTYVEYVFRRKISNVFSACVMARKCKNNCNHQYKSRHYWVIVANIFFSMMAVFHLTYLGFMFDSDPSVEEKGYDMDHTLKKWGELGYASHWLALFTLGFNLLL